MINFDDITHPVDVSLLIGMHDIYSFASYAKNRDSISIFNFLDRLAEISGEIIEGAGGRIIKFMGDGNLFVFPEELADEGVNACLHFQEEAVKFLKTQGLSGITVSCHFGEVTLGYLGVKGKKQLDVIGSAVNIPFLLHKDHPRKKVMITPQAFRKLSKETRKKFHKFTPPIVYLSE